MALTPATHYGGYISYFPPFSAYHFSKLAIPTPRNNSTGLINRCKRGQHHLHHSLPPPTRRSPPLFASGMGVCLCMCGHESRMVPLLGLRRVHLSTPHTPRYFSSCIIHRCQRHSGAVVVVAVWWKVRGQCPRLLRRLFFIIPP